MKKPFDPLTQQHRAVLLLGPTAAGKTPLGDLIEQRGLWGSCCIHFDFGENLRQVVDRSKPDEIVSRDDIEFLRGVLASGTLLEDEQFPIARHILQSFLADRQVDAQTQIVLNGLPRHVGQAEAVDAILNIATVIALDCSGETVLERIASNVGGDRTERSDDDLVAVGEKLAIFHGRTVPLIQHYTQRGARVEQIEVTAEATPDDVWNVLARR